MLRVETRNELLEAIAADAGLVVDSYRRKMPPENILEAVEALETSVGRLDDYNAQRVAPEQPATGIRLG